jgi:hypothetical protein
MWVFLAFAWFFMRYFKLFTAIFVQNALIAQVWQGMEVGSLGIAMLEPRIWGCEGDLPQPTPLYSAIVSRSEKRFFLFGFK